MCASTGRNVRVTVGNPVKDEPSTSTQVNEVIELGSDEERKEKTVDVQSQEVCEKVEVNENRDEINEKRDEVNEDRTENRDEIRDEIDVIPPSGMITNPVNDPSNPTEDDNTEGINACQKCDSIKARKRAGK